MELNTMDNQESTDQVQFESRIDLRNLQTKAFQIKQEIQKVIVGQDQIIDQLLVALLVKGHVLIEGVPGVAKTLVAKLVSQTISTGFSRIQFTPDLMPSDVLGTSIFNVKNTEFEFKKGPIFSNMILIDEINRAPAKTQSALFEVMEEAQVTIDGTSYQMSKPFMVLATQNPIEQEGTYRLPEAQLDRFLFKIKIGYPDFQQEVLILQNEHLRAGASKLDQVQSVITSEELLDFQDLISKILIEEHLLHYIAKIVTHTRENPLLFLGASSRASLAILHASKGFAAIQGRDFVTPEDIKQAAIPVLNHRIVVSPEREMEGLTAQEIINQIIETIDIPR